MTEYIYTLIFPGLLLFRKMSAKIPTIISAVGMYNQAPLGPAKAKFTTKFIQSGIPFSGQTIPSKAPAQTFSPRSIASITFLD